VAGNELAHAHAGEHAVDHSAGHGAGHDEPVIAPDQLKPTPFKRLIRLAATLTIIVLPVMAFFGNHEGNVEKVFLVGISGLMLLLVIVAFFLKRAGLRN
jgi:hypothetical protein